MSQEEKHELTEMAHQLAYHTIGYSGLYKSLSNEQWDRLAREMAPKVLEYVDRLVDAECTRREAEAA